MNEIWKDIDEFAGLYQVSNLGRVRRIGSYSNQNSSWDLKEPKILNERKHSNGYLRVMISKDGNHYDRYIHRLVAKEFCENENNYKEVNHIDDDKTNNTSDNLEWCSRSYNNLHAYKKGLHTLHGCYGNKKKVAQITMNGKIVKIHESVDIASSYVGNKSYSNISACCSYAEDNSRYKRPCISSAGFKWRFATNDMKVGDIVSD